jgi:hypothetical protein
MIYRVSNFANLLGDFLGALGTLDYLSKNKDIYFLFDELNDIRTGNTIDAKHFFHPFIPLLKNNRIKILESTDNYNLQIDVDAVRADHGYGTDNFMTKAYYYHLCSQIYGHRENIDFYPKAQLFFEETSDEKYDVLISPYGRSSTLNERIDLNIWREFIIRNKDFSFGILGQVVIDDYTCFEDLTNCKRVFNRDFNSLGNILLKSKIVLSIVNGISHFCFHTGTKNILFTNQSRLWGNNPDAVQIRHYIPDVTIDLIQEVFINNI